MALLGPVELADSQGGRIEVASRRQRQLLVILGLNCGRAVDIDTITELVWADDRPADPSATVQTNISRLRRLLEEPVSIETAPSGYLLSCPSDHVDVVRFESLLSRIRTEPAVRVPELAAEALALWRGVPLGDLDHPDIEAERQRLVELKLELTELLAEALYTLRRFGEAIALGEQHVRENPYRERPVAALMKALFAAGRQADALTAFAALRNRLLDDLGVDPSLELRNVEMAILRQDIDDAPPAGTDQPAGWVDITERRSDTDRGQSARSAPDVEGSRSAGVGDGRQADAGEGVSVDGTTAFPASAEPRDEPGSDGDRASSRDADRGRDREANREAGGDADRADPGRGGGRAGDSARPAVGLGQRIRICTTADGTRLAYAESGSGPPLVKAANWMTLPILSSG